MKIAPSILAEFSKFLEKNPESSRAIAKLKSGNLTYQKLAEDSKDSNYKGLSEKLAATAVSNLDKGVLKEATNIAQGAQKTASGRKSHAAGAPPRKTLANRSTRGISEVSPSPE